MDQAALSDVPRRNHLGLSAYHSEVLGEESLCRSQRAPCPHSSTGVLGRYSGSRGSTRSPRLPFPLFHPRQVSHKCLECNCRNTRTQLSSSTGSTQILSVANLIICSKWAGWKLPPEISPITSFSTVYFFFRRRNYRVVEFRKSYLTLL